MSSWSSLSSLSSSLKNMAIGALKGACQGALNGSIGESSEEKGNHFSFHLFSRTTTTHHHHHHHYHSHVHGSEIGSRTAPEEENDNDANQMLLEDDHDERFANEADQEVDEMFHMEMNNDSSGQEENNAEKKPERKQIYNQRSWLKHGPKANEKKRLKRLEKKALQAHSSATSP